MNIDRLALNQGWAEEVADWHRALALLIPPLAVAGIFREAQLVKDRAGAIFLTFTDTHKFKQARLHIEALEKIFGRKPHLQVLTVERSPRDLPKELSKSELKANYREKGVERR